MRGNKLYKALDGWLGRAGILLMTAVPRRGPDELPAGKVSKILVVKLSALGDTIILVPALRALRQRYPRAEIGLVGTRVNEEIALQYRQYIDHFFRLDVARAAREPWSLIEFVRELRAGRWQLGIDFDQWTHITPLLLRLADVPTRIGFRTGARVRHRLYTATERRRDELHEAENFLALLRPLGIEGGSLQLEMPVDPTALARARRQLREQGWNGQDPLIVLHPGTGAPGSVRAQRAWPAASYAELARRMVEEGERPFLAITAAPEERPLALELLDSQPAAGCVLTLELREFIACLSLATLVVSGNSGAMHIAAALGVPQIALHGPAGASRWGPLNRNAVVIESSCPGCPCLDMGWEYHRTDGHCMSQITVDEVLAPALQVLQAERPLLARAAR